MPSNYWAEWDPASAAPDIIRRDTRLYWQPQGQGTVGRCIGAFVGENPGSAESIHGLAFAGYSPIWQKRKRKPGDPTLRLLLEIWRQAVAQGLTEPESTDYIEILNTYYFRNAKSGGSLSHWRNFQQCPYHQLPASICRFILLGWGKGHTANPEATAMVPHLRPFSRIIVPNSDGSVQVVSGSVLNSPVQPGPVAPSFVLNRSKRVKPIYVANVAPELR